jgi:hypothetical protein
MLLKSIPSGEIGKGKEDPELKTGERFIRNAMLMLTSGERNIRRIGSLQSPNRAPVGEVIGVAVRVVVGDSKLLLRSGRDGQGALDSGGSSKHHKLGVFLMTEPMMFSPSSFPHTSNKMLSSEKKEHKKV